MEQLSGTAPPPLPPSFGRTPPPLLPSPLGLRTPPGAPRCPLPGRGGRWGQAPPRPPPGSITPRGTLRQGPAVLCGNSGPGPVSCKKSSDPVPCRGVRGPAPLVSALVWVDVALVCLGRGQKEVKPGPVDGGGRCAMGLPARVASCCPAQGAGAARPRVPPGKERCRFSERQGEKHS